MLDATRAELLDAGPDAVVRSTRIGIRLPEDQLLELGDRIQELIEDAHDRAAPLDDPSVPAYGGLFLLHRFAEDPDEDREVDDPPAAAGA